MIVKWDYRAVLAAILCCASTGVLAQGTPSAVIGGPPSAGSITGIVAPANGGTGVNNGTNTITLSVGGADPFNPPHQTTPFTIPFGTAGSYANSVSGNIFQFSSYITNSGSAPAVAIFGEGEATGTGSGWGGNFVGYANGASANAQGVEIDYGVLVNGGTATGLLIASAGNFAPTSALQIQANNTNSIPANDIVFQYRAGPGTNPASNALITTSGAGTPTYGIDLSAFTYGTAAIKLPGATTQAQGIAFGTDVHLYRSAGSMLLTDANLTFGSGPEIFTNTAAGVLQLGAGDSAGTPQAQSVFAQSVATGQTDTAGSALTIGASRGTGTGASGTIDFQVAVAGSTGSTQNARTTRLRLAATGEVLVGNNTARKGMTNGGAIPPLQVANNSATVGANGSTIISYRNSASVPATMYLAQSNSNTLGTQAAVASGSQLGSIMANGSDGTNFQDAAQILVSANGTVSAGVVPSKVDIKAANGSGVMTQVASFNGTGPVSTFSGQIIAADMTQSAAAQTGTVCWAAAGLTYDGSLACLASAETGKDVWGPLPDPLAKILSLEPIDFTWKPDAPRALSDPGNHYGLGAYKTGYVAEELIARDGDGNPRGWRQDAVVAVLVGAVQRQQQQIVLMRWVGAFGFFILLLAVGDLYRRSLAAR